jgi:hypothetical protein
VITVQAPTDDDLFDRAMLTPADLAVVTSGAAHRRVRDPVASAAPIAYDWGSPATAGLWRVDVRHGAGGPLVYRYFVKLLRHVRLWPGLAMLPTDALREEMASSFPWRFELDMYQSGIGPLLPAGTHTQYCTTSSTPAAMTSACGGSSSPSGQAHGS